LTGREKTKGKPRQGHIKGKRKGINGRDPEQLIKEAFINRVETRSHSVARQKKEGVEEALNLRIQHQRGAEKQRQKVQKKKGKGQ